MRVAPACLLALLAACGPTKPAEAGDDSSGALETDGGPTPTSATGETSDEVSTGVAPTGGTPGEMTSGVTTGATGSDPPVPGVTVQIVGQLSLVEGELTAFAEVPKFVPGPGFMCATQPDCAGNLPPTFGEPLFFVNGAWVDVLDVRVGDRVGVALPFADPDCNVGCGFLTSSMAGPHESMDSLGDVFGLPCESGPGLALDYTTLDIHGPYTWSVRLSDACDEKTIVEGGFEVAP